MRDALTEVASGGRQANWKVTTDCLCVDCQQAFQEERTLLWAECSCPPKIHMLKPDSQCDLLRGGAFGSGLDQEGKTLVNGIRTFIKEVTESSFVSSAM